jgi:hypothetical protein
MGSSLPAVRADAVTAGTGGEASHATAASSLSGAATPASRPALFQGPRHPAARFHRPLARCTSISSSKLERNRRQLPVHRCTCPTMSRVIPRAADSAPAGTSAGYRRPCSRPPAGTCSSGRPCTPRALQSGTCEAVHFAPPGKRPVRQVAPRAPGQLQEDGRSDHGRPAAGLVTDR